MADFKRVVVVCNPVSTNAHNAERRVAELQALPGVEVKIIRTVKGGRDANKRNLRKYADLFDEHTLIGVAAGDGTVSMVIEALLTDAHYPASVRKTPLLPLWCGNANDLAHMLNGSSYKATLTDILENGKVIAVQPIKCVFTKPSGVVKTYTAACYASFGASAFATIMLDASVRPHNRLYNISAIRFAHEFFMVVSAMMRAPVTTIEEAGKRRSVYEDLYLNGSRFAKISRVKRQLTAPGFYRATVEQKNFWRVVASIMALANPKKAKAFEGTDVQLVMLEATTVQLDGEVVQLPAGTRVHMTVNKRPFYALATTTA